MAVKIFFCYAHEDETLMNKLKMHLKPLHRQGLIDMWHDRDISAGTEWEREISQHLNVSNIILLLVSPDFMNSDYCYGIEMQRALERHKREEARVIPIILRHVYWQGEPLGKLQALPTDAKPVMSSSWDYQDEAFFNVTEGIRKVIEELITKLSDNSAMKDIERVEELPKASSTILPVTPTKQRNPIPTNLDKNIINSTIKNSKSDATDSKLPNSDETVEEIDSFGEEYYVARSIREAAQSSENGEVSSANETTETSSDKLELSSKIPQPSGIEDDLFAYMEDIQPIGLPEQRASTFIHDIDQGIPDISDVPTDVHDVEVEDLGDEGEVILQHDLSPQAWADQMLKESGVQETPRIYGMLPGSSRMGNIMRPSLEDLGTEDDLFTNRPSSAQQYHPSVRPRRQGQGNQPNFILVPQDRNNGDVGRKMSLARTFGVVFILLSLTLFIFNIATTHSLTLIASLFSIVPLV
jgi:hypothetical protein